METFFFFFLGGGGGVAVGVWGGGICLVFPRKYLMKTNSGHSVTTHSSVHCSRVICGLVNSLKELFLWYVEYYTLEVHCPMPYIQLNFVFRKLGTLCLMRCYVLCTVAHDTLKEAWFSLAVFGFRLFVLQVTYVNKFFKSTSPILETLHEYLCTTQLMSI